MIHLWNNVCFLPSFQYDFRILLSKLQPLAFLPFVIPHQSHQVPDGPAPTTSTSLLAVAAISLPLKPLKSVSRLRPKDELPTMYWHN